jgi:hypothetical protein
MNIKERTFFLLALCFTAITVGYVTYCIGVENSKCVTLSPCSTCMGDCQNVGAVQCNAGSSDCSYCNTESAIPLMSCVAFEGSTCTQGGGGAGFCVGGSKVVGICTDNGCVELPNSGGSCGDAGGPYFPCN